MESPAKSAALVDLRKSEWSMQRAEVAGHQGHLGLRLSDAGVRSQATVDSAAQVFSVAQPIVVRMNQRLKAEWKPEIRCFTFVPTKLCGVIPTIVKATPFKRTVLPSTAGSRQSASASSYH